MVPTRVKLELYVKRFFTATSLYELYMTKCLQRTPLSYPS